MFLLIVRVTSGICVNIVCVLSAAQLSQRGWLERFGRNTYLRLRTIGYQNLREESLSIATQEIRQPVVLPQADWYWFGTPQAGVLS